MSAVDETRSLHGTVIRRAFGVGTKSEHESIGLKVGARTYRLRRRDGNPFRDPVLEALVGKRLRATGITTGPDLIMTDWSEIAPRPRRVAVESGAEALHEQGAADDDAASDPTTSQSSALSRTQDEAEADGT